MGYDNVSGFKHCCCCIYTVTKNLFRWTLEAEYCWYSFGNLNVKIRLTFLYMRGICFVISFKHFVHHRHTKHFWWFWYDALLFSGPSILVFAESCTTDVKTHVPCQSIHILAIRNHQRLIKSWIIATISFNCWAFTKVTFLNIVSKYYEICYKYFNSILFFLIYLHAIINNDINKDHIHNVHSYVNHVIKLFDS
jgi:hypothetical protein